MRKSKKINSDEEMMHKDTPLNGFFNEEEVKQLMKDINLESHFQEGNKKRLSQILFDRSFYILKILKSAIEKLYSTENKLIAKGLEWIQHEIQDSLIFKADDKELEKFSKMKGKSQEMENIFSFLEEYSSMKFKHKDNLESLKIKTNNSEQTSYYTDRSVDFSEDSFGTQRTNKQLQTNFSNGSSYLDFSEECFATIDKPTFDIFKLEKEVGEENSLSTVTCYIFITMGLYSHINYNNLENFLHAITKGYTRKNSYHNDLHAADVEHTCFLFLKYGNLQETMKLYPIDIASFLISAIIHDYKHPGLTNNFLINTKNEVAVKYNDVSVLENYHLAEAFKLIFSDPKYNIFEELAQDEFKIVRKRIVECVLSTDMSFHTKQFSYAKIKKENFEIKEGKNAEKIFDIADNTTLFNTQQEFLNIFLHTADISNPTKPLIIYEQWVHRLLTELFLQGDQEKQLKLNVSFLCDRETTSIPKSQCGFIEGIVNPLVSAVVEIFPGLSFLKENCEKNKEYFKKLKDEEDSLKKLK